MANYTPPCLVSDIACQLQAFPTVANEVAHSWRHRFGAVPGVWNVVFRWHPTVRRPVGRFQAFATPEIVAKKLLPVCCRHGGKRSESTWRTSNNGAPSSKHARLTRNSSGTSFPVCCRQRWIWLKLAGPVPDNENPSRNDVDESG